MVALSHEMIPHHHHDAIEYEISYRSVSSRDHHHDEDHIHYGDHHEHHHYDVSQSEDEHDHSFPNHHHFTADKDLDYIRISGENGSSSNVKLIAVLFTLSTLQLKPPLKVEPFGFADIPFYRHSTFEPGAAGLRAPPSIA